MYFVKKALQRKKEFLGLTQLFRVIYTEPRETFQQVLNKDKVTWPTTVGPGHNGV